ncbi:Lrp/AsnC family transcriptional regulator [Mesorhizobium sp. M0924]|uniref:Lrp/AsnC family transcriptional regulator n=1 Tax=unclassified Mesorhizobium TaxID=325217 RepID=UPI0003CEC98B|nr:MULTISPECIES: Lrp/AsnC family transcriptional regulator [unclassified Mesorhizobium]ESX58116.1 ArsR family transcriptional regulator [Mesorhizobium sp. LSHC422A00]ESY13617.1 ArsR family transcriptional regulator [Mesorhizobium sp. LNJC398B00]ESY38378.1 ArsR family transcriptional regulator [Mesorhizobium sp. LNJC386A00]
MRLDRLDARLLSIVQAHNRHTSEELGEMVGLSATAVQRRVKRLRDEGVIEADISVVKPKAIGRPIAMLVSVSLERERVDIVDRFKQSIRQTAEVMNGYYVTGDADFVLIVTARSMEDYEVFTRKFFYENPDIKGFKTMVIMDRVKVGFSVPIDAADFS